MSKYISLQEIINQLIKIRYILYIIIILGLTGSIYLIINNEINWKASIKFQQIDTINSQQYDYFQEVNKSVLRTLDSLGKNLESLASSEDDDLLTNIITDKSFTNSSNEMQVRQFMVKFDEELISFFADKAGDENLVLEVLDEIEILDKSNFDSEKLYYDQLKKMVIKLKISQPITTPENKAIYKRDYNPFWQISFTSKNKIKSKEAVYNVLSKANKDVGQFMKDNFNEYLKLLKLPYEEKISMLESRKKLLINQYDMSRENTIAFLEEQAKLARSIGYDKSAEGAQNIAINILPQISLGDSGNDDYYLRGYELIESQIELLNNRDDNFNKYIPDLIQAESLIIAINELCDENIKKLEKAFKNTPILNDDFMSIRYNESKISYDKVGNSNLVLFIFSLLVSLVICVLVLFLSLIISNYKENLTN